MNLSSTAGRKHKLRLATPVGLRTIGKFTAAEAHDLIDRHAELFREGMPETVDDTAVYYGVKLVATIRRTAGGEAEVTRFSIA